jgi:hypothetical protein
MQFAFACEKIDEAQMPQSPAQQDIAISHIV